MLKNKTKIVVLALTLILLVSTVSFATDTTDVATSQISENQPVATSENTIETTEQSTPEITEDDIYSGDLYIFENNVVMDKLVDGNVFIMGQNVEITGKVNGSLYILANKVTISEESYIVQTLYVCANELTLNGAANDLYALCNKIDMPYNSFIIRDLRVAASTFNFAGGVGRDAFVEANNFTFAKDEGNSAIVYGNLTYSSSNELELSEDLVNGTVSYTQLEVNTENDKNISEIILDKLMELCQTLIYTAVVFALILWLAPNFAKKSADYISVKKTPVSIGIGILGFVVASIGSILLLITGIAAPLAVSVFGVFALMMAIAFAITAICISYKIKDKYNLKNSTYGITLLLVTIALWALEIIPYIGWIVSMIVSLFGFGTILAYLVTKNKKVETESKETK